MTTWLKGSTTWANLVSDITKLCCGEIADGSSVTCAAGDQWTRVDASDDTILSPSSSDVTLGAMSNRLGYATLLSYKPTVGSLTEGGQTFIQSVCRQKNIYTSTPTGVTARWEIRFNVDTANTVSGNYSTASITWLLYNDTGANILSGSFSPASDGSWTGGNGSQWQFTDPGGFLTAGTQWTRSFTTTYVGGIDWWGSLFQRRRADATFSVSPPAGVTGTDWVANVEIPSASSGSAIGGAYGSYFSGLGIKTNTALTGGLYTFSYNAALHSLRLANGSSSGLVDLYYGGRRLSDSGTYRQQNGYLTASFLRIAQTLASVTSGLAIQYWLAISPNRVVIVLNADPAGTGKLTCNGVGAFTARYAYDKFPVFTGTAVTDYTGDVGPTNLLANGGFTLYQQKIRQDGSEGRDWQTGWGRGENAAISATDELSSPLPQNTASSSVKQLRFVNFDPNLAIRAQHPREEKPSRFDSKWHLYPIWVEDLTYPQDTFMRIGELHRGRIDAVPFIPGDSWVSGDELTDSVSGNKYFLVGADYHGSGCVQRYKMATNNYAGGAAILENA